QHWLQCSQRHDEQQRRAEKEGFAGVGLMAELVPVGKHAAAPMMLAQPCVTLGGLSPIAFQVLRGDSLPMLCRTTSRASNDLVRGLIDQNEYLEDTHGFMSEFIERQKDRIEQLENQVKTLR
ncbi:Uncharacterized protein SCF082_LOCUS33644, partial [Durusdinium trenchii]